MSTTRDSRVSSTNLLPQHQKLITDSAIAPEIAQERGYRSVETKAELKRLGFSDRQCCVPGLLIPIWGVTGEIVCYQLRPDQPRIGKNGKPAKYETPKGARMALDVHPSIREKLQDPSIPLVITEGARKGDCAISHGLCALALLGVWNWRGSNDLGGMTVLSDFEHIALNGRQVYVCFDSDVMIKREVHLAMSRLKAFLESRAARVSLIYLPPGDGGIKVGLDDYLAAGHSVDELLSLATQELRTCSDDQDEIFPVPYKAASDGLVWKKRTGEGTVDVRLTNFTARIVADVSEDDGSETRHLFEIEAALNNRATRFTVPANQFSTMNWPVEHLGANAVVYAGFGLRDHARTAVQLLSTDICERRVYTHTGWRKVNGVWMYLHSGGAIGPKGIAEGFEVNLPDLLGAYCLPVPPDGDELRAAILASMDVLKLAPDVIVVPLYACIWRALLGSADLSLHLSGPTGAGKTELAALVQQHWGSTMDARHLPGSWSSTGNALEALAFTLKDAALVVDDFCPTGSSADIARLHRDANRLLRAQANQLGRQRMRSDATLRPAKAPRGLTVSTGEDIPRGQSLRARFLVLEVSPDSLDFAALTQCQHDARTGLYAQALAGFVRWLAPQFEGIHSRLREDVARLRDAAFRSHLHRRTPDIVANLMVGLDLFLQFAVEAGALDVREAEILRARGWSALGEAASCQAQHQAASEPTRRFIELLRAAIASGRAHVAAMSGGPPDTPESWGWRESPVGTSDYARSDWRPQGDRVGWLDGDDLYLEPEAAYAAAQRMARDGGDTISVGSRTLHKRLREKDLLASTEGTRGTLTVRRVAEGCRRSVVHLKAGSLLSPETDQPDHAAVAEGESGQFDGQFPGRFNPTPAIQTDRENCPHPTDNGQEPAGVVSLVSLDTAGEREVFEL